MENELVITVNIGGRSYKLRVAREEEGRIRKAVNDIERYTREYGKTYAYRDIQDLLAMVALQQTTAALKLEEATDYRENELQTKLKEIEELLSDA